MSFNITPLLKRADLMWYHERLRAGQQVFEFYGLRGELTCHGYEIALHERGSVDLGLLAMWFKRRDRTEADVMYYQREGAAYRFLRGESYPDLPSDEFLNLMAELNDEEFLTGEWRQ